MCFGLGVLNLCWMGQARAQIQDGMDRMGSDYIDNLSPSFCFWLGLGLWLRLRFVNLFSLLLFYFVYMEVQK